MARLRGGARRDDRRDGAGRVAFTIRIALSSAPRASAAVGETFANFTRSQADSQPWISPRVRMPSSRPS